MEFELPASIVFIIQEYLIFESREGQVQIDPWNPWKVIASGVDNKRLCQEVKKKILREQQEAWDKREKTWERDSAWAIDFMNTYYGVVINSDFETEARFRHPFYEIYGLIYLGITHRIGYICHCRGCSRFKMHIYHIEGGVRTQKICSSCPGLKELDDMVTRMHGHYWRRRGEKPEKWWSISFNGWHTEQAVWKMSKKREYIDYSCRMISGVWRAILRTAQDNLPLKSGSLRIDEETLVKSMATRVRIVNEDVVDWRTIFGSKEEKEVEQKEPERVEKPVRGHWRQYRNGKRIWIEPFTRKWKV